MDWHRFASEALLGCYRAEAEVLREVTPDVPVTTNLMGPFFRLDYHRWADELDVVSWDNYPGPHDPPSTVAFNHTLMRGLRGGQPFLLMEQSPSQQNWQPYNWLKPPGVLRLQSFQAVAHGAESVMYFQWRRSRGGIEKLHGAVVEHHGRSDTRVFGEVAEIGRELAGLGTRTLGGRVPARAAVLFDWPNWWGLTYSSGPSVDLDYLAECRAAYAALHGLGVQVDVVSPRADLGPYDLVVAPVLTMVDEEVGSALAARVRAGATLLVTPFSGLVDGNDLVHPGGPPGPLRDVLGLTVEETDALPPDRTNGLRFVAPLDGLPAGEVLPCGVLCERLLLSGAEPVAVYFRDFYVTEPALTRNRLRHWSGVLPRHPADTGRPVAAAGRSVRPGRARIAARGRQGTATWSRGDPARPAGDGRRRALPPQPCRDRTHRAGHAGQVHRSADGGVVAGSGPLARTLCQDPGRGTPGVGSGVKLPLTLS